MTLIKSKKTLGTLLCTGILAGCAASNAVKEESKTIQQIHASSVATKDTQYKVEVMPFSVYNPPTTSEFINLDDAVRVYLEKGLDNDLQVHEEKFQVEGYFAFENLIYDEARKLGHIAEDVQNMSPKQAVQLACDIAAQRVNYFGSIEDFKTRQERAYALAKIKSALQTVLENPAIPPEQKEKMKVKEKYALELERKWNEINGLEFMLNSDPSPVGGVYGDHMTADKMLQERTPVVCRHYTEIVSSIFFVLKTRNQRLANTRVCDYTDRGHAWNQVSTVFRNNDQLHIAISFMDPTAYDLQGNIEGYDEDHFPNNYLLTAQIDKLPGKKHIHPVVSRMRMHFF